MKFKISFTLLMALLSLYTISIFGFANSIDKLNPPLPEHKLDISAELKYIYLSDQKDREFLIDSSKKYSSLMDVNDSIRLTRVIEIDKGGLLQSQTDKYFAAFIYHHKGGSKMTDDSVYSQRAIRLCNEILNSGQDEFIKDTISLKELNQNSLLKSFQELVFKTLKIDTVISNQSYDTLLIVNYKLSQEVESLKRLAESEFKSKYQNENPTKSINLNDIDNPESLSKIREHLRKNIIESLEKKSPLVYKLLSEEQINELVEESLQNLINIKKGVIEEMKNNPEKYKEKWIEIYYL